MTFQIGLLLVLIGVSLVLFALEWISPDVTALGLLSALVCCGLLSSKEAFAGFGSDTVLMMLGLLILMAALLRTGVMEWAAVVILRFTGKSALRLLAVIMIAASTLSAFMSNTASTAFFVPIVIGLAARAKVSPSKLLLPLAFSSILSSSVTLISTSTNLVVSGLLPQYGLAPLGMFELAPVGIPIVIVGLLYLFFVGRRWLPEHQAQENAPGSGGIRLYLSEVLILPNSRLCGKTLAEAAFGRDLDLTVLRIIRNKTEHLAPYPNSPLRAHDVLLVEGRIEDILKIKDTVGVEIKADVKLSDPEVRAENLDLVEVILLPRSPLIGRSLKSYRFRDRFGLQVLGINRHGHALRQKLSLISLRMGDTLIVQGSREKLAALEENKTFRVLGSLGDLRPNRKLAPLAIGIFLGALVLGTCKIVELPVAMIMGAVLVFATRCITPDEAYREVEWKAIILIGSMLALGAAMEQTGAAKYLASLIGDRIGGASPLALLGGFFVLTVVLTQPMSNQAAAVVLVPVAIELARHLHLNPRTFVMMITVAASCSYLTPLEPSCLMVYGPGRYRFSDFFKVGSILTVLIFLVAILLVPIVWPVK